MRLTLVRILAGALIGAAGVDITTVAQPGTPAEVALAHFNPDGEVEIPIGYRRWVHIGTRYKPIGVNILDGLETKTPEILNAYAEPSALAIFTKTGQWPEGSQIVKEFSAVRGGDGCDASSWICQSSLGAGIFEDRYIGLGMMVKDSRRFPEAPGHWGYFSFGHKPLPYDTLAAPRPLAACASCHVRLAADTDYVVSRAHLGLAEPIGEGD